MSRAARRVFGLGVWSDVPLQPLDDLPIARQINVRIWLRSLPSWLPALGSTATDGQIWYSSPYLDDGGRPLVTASFVGDGKYLRLLYKEGTEFFLDRRGTEIAARWPDSLTVDDIVSYVLGPVLGLLLRLRGTTCLHASAVAMDGRAIAFVGIEGSGKSTLAAALAVRGFPVISDDIVPLEARDDAFLVHSAWARVRLWPPSVRALARLESDDHWQRAMTSDRRYNVDLLRHGYGFHVEPLPLGAIYLLTRDEPNGALGIEPVAAREALMALVADTFAARLLDRPARAREFEVLAQLVASVPVRRVRNGAGLDRLADLCDAVHSDVTRILGTAHPETSPVGQAASPRHAVIASAGRTSFE